MRLLLVLVLLVGCSDAEVGVSTVGSAHVAERVCSSVGSVALKFSERLICVDERATSRTCNKFGYRVTAYCGGEQVITVRGDQYGGS